MYPVPQVKDFGDFRGGDPLGRHLLDCRVLACLPGCPVRLNPCCSIYPHNFVARVKHILDFVATCWFHQRMLCSVCIDEIDYLISFFTTDSPRIGFACDVRVISRRSSPSVGICIPLCKASFRYETHKYFRWLGKTCPTSIVSFPRHYELFANAKYDYRHCS